MNPTLKDQLNKIRKRPKLTVFVLLALIFWFWKLIQPTPVIKLYIGEPWEEMRKNSTATIVPAIYDSVYDTTPKQYSALVFDDGRYTFRTPKSKFFMIMYDDKKVDNIQISPTMHTMTLDESLDLIDNLQTQWKSNGWFLTNPKEFPALDRSKDLMERYKACLPVSTYWQAEHKYQIIVAFSCFGSKDLFGRQQYMVTLGIATPWVQTPAELDQQERQREAKAKREGKVYIPLPR